MIGIVRALRRHERVARVAIPSIAVKEADAAYLGEPPPPLSVVQITDTGAGRYVIDGPVGHVETLLHDDFLHVGAGLSHTSSQRHDITGTRTTTSSSFSNLGAEAAISTTFTKYHDGSDLIGGGQINAYSIGPGVAQLQVSLQINGTDNVIIDAQLNAVVGVVEWPNGTSDPITGVPAGTYTVTFRWRRASGGGTIQTDATQQASFWITETGGVMGDTGWERTEFVSSGPNLATVTPAVPTGETGEGVARIQVGAAAGPTSTLALHKTPGSLVLPADRALWVSARAAIGADANFYFGITDNPEVGFSVNDVLAHLNDVSGAVLLRADNGVATDEVFLRETAPTLGEFFDLDLVVVAGELAAMWFDGGGPVWLDNSAGEIPSDPMHLSVGVGADSAESEAWVDWITVKAFNTGPPQELNPDGTITVPPPAVHPRLLDALEPVEADAIEVTPG